MSEAASQFTEDTPLFEIMKEERKFDPDKYLKKAKEAIKHSYKKIQESVDPDWRMEPLEDDEIYIVWFSKVLQNWKALVSTTREDGRYYEVTYNGDRCEMYVDIYGKTINVAISDSNL